MLLLSAAQQRNWEVVSGLHALVAEVGVSYVVLIGVHPKKVCRLDWPELYVYTPYMTVYLVISLPKVPHLHRIITEGAN